MYIPVQPVCTFFLNIPAYIIMYEVYSTQYTVLHILFFAHFILFYFLILIFYFILFILGVGDTTKILYHDMTNFISR